MKRIWRVTQRSYIESAFNGEGARSEGGRWNSVGTAMVYASGNLSLAVLEALVHLKFAQSLSLYVAIPADIGQTQIESLPDAVLPENWQDDPSPLALQQMGDQWCQSNNALALAVPSAVVAVEKNYLINPRHQDFPALQIGDPIALPIDPRLLENLSLV